ncbi:hypothetical protein IE81DRAFT_325313 [Ceraceosorus guamensis]|uniref:Probable vacuolar protein sorting-associated protein 16 homolog n=1 Tax=Ceraceosorus guamensis TaxID=1522189 RepID=A0A316VWQ7_9BASI|nr:hypothetical protein IE81DRAFT_325313 [Ceraceosorus guamensis]PWN40711.1 hypothetical protein IE81DRAFT_325313 [Ceraceosorus guamensis]
MTLTHPTQEWHSLQDVFYRRNQVYSLSWAIDDLSNYKLAAAPNGGLLALVRDPAKLVALGKVSNLRPKIQVYTSAGQLVESIPWNASDRIIALGFTDDEQLIVVLEEGAARLYTFFSPCPAQDKRTLQADRRSENQSYSSVSGPTPTEVTASCYYTQYSLGAEAVETGIEDARMWSQGLVIRTRAGRFVEWSFPFKEGASEGAWSKRTLSIPAPILLPSIPSETSTNFQEVGTSMAAESQASVGAWDIIPSTVSNSGLVEVLLSPTSSAQEGTLLSLDSLSGSTDLRLTRGPFHTIRPSPNGALLALLTHDEKVWVVSSDLQRSLSEYDLGSSEAFESNKGKGLGGTGVEDVRWCGNNSVVLSSESEVVMVGPFGEVLRFPYSGAVHLIPETDAVRIIGSDRHDFLQKVPEATSSVFQPGSTHPAALLFDASEHFAAKSAKADEGVRAIKNQLAEAVDTCVEAAAYEWDAAWQRKLLRAASFGKAFVDLYDTAPFVKLAKALRILNAARRHEIGVPVSYDEYKQIGATALIARLTARNHHLLCLRVSEHLNLRPDPVLKHWAQAKIMRTRPAVGAIANQAFSAVDDVVCKAIVEKFESQPAVSYAEIAQTAWDQGRTRLATKLLDHEPRAVDQVPLLLNMQEDKAALIKAIESGDTDLVYHVLLRLKSQLSRGDFFRILQAPAAEATTAAMASNKPPPSATDHIHLAANLLEVYARSEDQELLRDFYYQDDRRTDGATLSLEEAAGEDDLQERIFKIKEAQRLFGEDKDRSLEAKLAEEDVRLLGFQAAMEREEGGRSTWLGCSLAETIRQLLIRGDNKRAEKLRSDFKLTDARFGSIKVSALIVLRDWEGLWNFAGARKAPALAFETLSRLVTAGYVRESTRYVPRVMADKIARSKLSSLIQRLPQSAAQAVGEAMDAEL